MLFETTNGPADVINAYTELFGDGRVMDAMRKLLTAEEKEQEQRERREIRRLAWKVKAYKLRRYIMGDLGVVPECEVPDFHYHRYAGAFEMKAREAGIELPEKGYECWQDEDFLAFYRRKYPELFYDEAPRNARILVNEHGHLPLVAASPLYS